VEVREASRLAQDARLYYVTTEATKAVIVDVETVLIYIHQPNQNSSKINWTLPYQRYLIHNTGDCPIGLLPVIDTAFPWFGLRAPNIAAGTPDECPIDEG